MAQAVLSATQTVDIAYSLHSLHCYFIAAASKPTPVKYVVEKVRDGRSYVARNVRAYQEGTAIVNVECSFTKPDPLQPTFHLPIPEVGPPEQYMTETDWFKEQLPKAEDASTRLFYSLILQDLNLLPVEARFAEIREDGQGGQMTLWWLKFTSDRVIDKAAHDVTLHKCILAFLSDNQNFNIVPMSALNLTYAKGPRQIMAQQRASVHHTVSYYSQNYDPSDWLLYVATCPVAGDGRGIASGRMYARSSGELLAVTMQEGVFRTDTRKAKDKSNTKL